MGVTKKTWDGYCGDDIDEERMKNITVNDTGLTTSGTSSMMMS